MLKRFVSLCVLFSTLFSFGVFANNSDSLAPPVAVFTIGSNTYLRYGEVLPIDADNPNVMPYISENRTYVPVRALCEAFNVEKIDYDDETKLITILKGERVVLLQIDTPIRSVNGDPYPMDVNSIAADGRTYLPARFIAEALAIKTVWNEDTNTVIFLELTESDFYALLTDDNFKIGDEVEAVGAIGLPVRSVGLPIRVSGQLIDNGAYVFYELLGGGMLTLKENRAAVVNYSGGIVKIFDRDKKQFVSEKSFDFELLSKMPSDKNYMISPYSLKMALAMAANGADGQTKQEILDNTGIIDLWEFDKKNMGFIEKSNSNKLVEFNIANSIWFNKDYFNDEKLNFSDKFKFIIEEIYGGSASDVDNKNGAKTINDWISKETNGKIKDVIKDDMLPEVLMFLVNAIYFKGDWSVPFKAEGTSDNTFTDRAKNEKTTAFMNDLSYYFYYENDNFQILKKPYKDNETSMYFVLPKNDNPVSETDFYSALDNMTEEYVYFSLPKFKTEYLHTNLIEILKNMGIKTAFSMEDANFLPMFSKESPQNIFIKIILQKTFIEVDEKGTEAAAATAVGGGAGSAMRPEPIEFICDRPFTYFIMNKNTSDILFMGEYAYVE